MSFLDNLFGGPSQEETNFTAPGNEPKVEDMLDNNDNDQTKALGFQRDVNEAEAALHQAEKLRDLAAAQESADHEAAAQLVEQRKAELEEAVAAQEMHNSQSPDSIE